MNIFDATPSARYILFFRAENFFLNNFIMAEPLVSSLIVGVVSKSDASLGVDNPVRVG